MSVARERDDEVKILWAQNPLETIVELDEHDKAILRLKLVLERLEEAAFSVHFAVEKGLSKEKILEELDVDYYFDNGERGGRPFRMSIDEDLERSVQSLREAHDGDCVCSACACLKCRTENLLAIGPISGLGKHAGRKIRDAFLVRGSNASIGDAIHELETHYPTNTTPGWSQVNFESHIPRWLEDQRKAAEWMTKYRSAHFAVE